MIAPPCATCSRALRKPVRSHDYIYGLPNLSPINQQKVDNANRCYQLAAKVAQALNKKQRPWIIENPHSSFMWHIPEIRDLFRLRGVRYVVIDQCMFGADWRKRTGLLCGNVEPEYFMDRACRTKRGGICSRTGKPHIHLTGKDSDGVCRTAKAATYPHDFADRLGNAIATTIRMPWYRGLLERSKTQGTSP